LKADRLPVASRIARRDVAVAESPGRLAATELVVVRWSQHAFGRAIDLNPLLNPYIDRTGAFQPKNAAPYLDRNRTDPGLLHAGDAAVRAFTDRGWRWGGDWRTPKHFDR
jgi:hypothetical protein